MNGISRETFAEMPVESKLNVLFDIALEQHQCACNVEEKLNLMEDKLNRSKKIDKGVAAGAGFMGGFIAFFTEKLFKL